MLCVRGGGNTIPFEEDSLPPLIYLLLLNDSVIQPQNQSPEEGRKSPALKHQCPCEVLLCGTFLKNNHIRRLSGQRNSQTILWGSWRTQQPGMGILRESGQSVFSPQRQYGLWGEGSGHQICNLRYQRVSYPKRKNRQGVWTGKGGVSQVSATMITQEA